MSNEDNGAAPVAETPVAETPVTKQYAEGQLHPDLQQFADQLQHLRTSYQQLMQNLSSEKVYDALTAGLSCHPGFINLVRSISIEAMAEQVSNSQHDHAHEFVMEEFPGVSHYEATLSREPTEHSVLRVTQFDADHPTQPNGFDGFVRPPGSEEWVPVKLAPKLLDAVTKVFQTTTDIARNVYYWVELNAFSAEPLSEDSVVNPTAENGDGQAG